MSPQPKVQIWLVVSGGRAPGGLTRERRSGAPSQLSGDAFGGIYEIRPPMPPLASFTWNCSTTGSILVAGSTAVRTIDGESNYKDNTYQASIVRAGKHEEFFANI